MNPIAIKILGNVAKVDDGRRGYSRRQNFDLFGEDAAARLKTSWKTRQTRFMNILEREPSATQHAVDEVARLNGRDPRLQVREYGVNLWKEI